MQWPHPGALTLDPGAMNFTILVDLIVVITMVYAIGLSGLPE